jgi:hypothetical protein
VATGTFQVNVAPTTQYFTRMLVPSDGATVQGLQVLDAAAGDGPGIASVTFELSGNGLTNQVVATGTPTIYGYLAKWNTTSVPNGTYSLQSVATDKAANTDTSAPITITVTNQPPSTAVLIPSDGATVSGAKALLDASASSAVGIASLTYEVSGNALSDQVVATGTPTLYGYLAQWNSTVVPNGTYTLQSVATDTTGVSTTSVPITVTVDNPLSTSVIVPASGATIDTAKGLVFDAVASAGATAVSIAVSANGQTITYTTTSTLYGWIAVVPAFECAPTPCLSVPLPDSIVSVATFAGGVSVTSPPVTGTIIAYCPESTCGI